jgi:hypothetical protein
MINKHNKNAMNMSICVLAIRAFQLADQAFLQTSPVRRIVEAGRRPQHEIVAPPQCPQEFLAGVPARQEQIHRFEVAVTEKNRRKLCELTSSPQLPQLYWLFPRMRSPRKSKLVLEASESGLVITVIATTTVMKEADVTN